MVKLKKSEEEKRRFIILQELKIKTNERLEKKDVTWERNINEEIPNEYFNGFSVKKRKKNRKSSIPYKIRQYLYNKTKDRNPGGKNGISIEKLKILANKRFKKRLHKKLTSSTNQNYLKKRFKRVYPIRRRPVLSRKNVEKRSQFAQSIINNNITSNMIFFTDEKRF